MAVEVIGLDVGTLKSEIQKTYTDVSERPDSGFVFPTGRAWAEELGYLKALLDHVPESACESFAVATSNGVIDLLPDKTAVFDEIYRVLRPGGRMQISDVTIQQPVSEEGKRDIDLWTG